VSGYEASAWLGFGAEGNARRDHCYAPELQSCSARLLYRLVAAAASTLGVGQTGAAIAGAGAWVGWADADWAGAATAGFFFSAVRFFTGCNSTLIGFGASCELSAASLRTETVCGWYPLSVSVSEYPSAACTSSSQGVRQLLPSDVLASAPGGFDSIRSACVGGEELGLTADEEHAASVKPHATTVMTRLMIGSPPSFPGSENLLKCGDDEEIWLGRGASRG
jgi:hypothetical protein